MSDNSIKKTWPKSKKFGDDFDKIVSLIKSNKDVCEHIYKGLNSNSVCNMRRWWVYQFHSEDQMNELEDISRKAWRKHND